MKSDGCHVIEYSSIHHSTSPCCVVQSKLNQKWFLGDFILAFLPLLHFFSLQTHNFKQWQKHLLLHFLLFCSFIFKYRFDRFHGRNDCACARLCKSIVSRLHRILQQNTSNTSIVLHSTQHGHLDSCCFFADRFALSFHLCHCFAWLWCQFWKESVRMPMIKIPKQALNTSMIESSHKPKPYKSIFEINEKERHSFGFIESLGPKYAYTRTSVTN